jgi:hypothetical protein
MKYNLCNISLTALGVLPLGFITSLIMFYFHARLILGHFPNYNYPDPKELEVYNFYSLIINTTASIWVICIIVTVPIIATYFIVK